jgi:hypothetical protein
MQEKSPLWSLGKADVVVGAFVTVVPAFVIPVIAEAKASKCDRK